MLAKAELHVHLEGTAPPELIARIAKRNGVALPDGMLAEDGQFHYTDFLHFLQTYDLAASVIRTAEDYRDITYEYLAGVARDGGIYVELTASPDHAALVGLSDEEHYAGIAAGIDDARRDHGIEARILVSAVRNFGAEQALRVARQAAERPHPYVVGFALAGDERVPPTEFAEAFTIAADAGLGCTVHAGEWQGPESIRRRCSCRSRASTMACARSRTRRSFMRSPSAGSRSTPARPAMSCWASTSRMRSTRFRTCAPPGCG